MNVDARVIYFDVETQRSAQEVVWWLEIPRTFRACTRGCL